MTNAKSWLDSWPVFDEEESFFEEEDEMEEDYNGYISDLPDDDNFVIRATPEGVILGW